MASSEVMTDSVGTRMSEAYAQILAVRAATLRALSLLAIGQPLHFAQSVDK
jgi:hypothetical protein